MPFHKTTKYTNANEQTATKNENHIRPAKLIRTESQRTKRTLFRGWGKGNFLFHLIHCGENKGRHGIKPKKR